jgi:hypothetical protein
VIASDVGVIRKARFDWIVEDVPRERSRVISIAQDAVEIAFLP